ncbi:MAG: DUF885 domain-containing protein [Pseudomonadota bacterium]|nr:DUF885 domain-containing protein [Pseudomonadota bacterium]
MRLRSFLIGTSCLALMAACSPSGETPEDTATPAGTAATETAPATETQASEQTETERLFAWFDEQFQEDLDRSPLFKTYLGMIDQDLEAYGQWNDVSEDRYREDLQRAAERMRYMRENFDYDALSHEGQVAWRFAEFITANDAQQSEFWDHGYIFTQFFGPHTQMPTVLIGYHRIDNVDHAEAYISRLNGLGDVIETYTAQADERAQAGVLAPAFAYPVVITAARRFITGTPFDDSGADSPLLADFRGKVEALDIEQAEKDDLIARAAEALETEVEPAYTALIETMEAHAEMAGGRNQGAWSLPEGESFYRSQLDNYTTRTDLSAADIHQTGLDEVDRIHGEMRDIMAEVGFEGTLQDFFEHLRTDDRFYYPDTDEGRQQYLDQATGYVDHVMEIAPQYFDTLPRADLEVRAVEEYRIETATGAFYESGSLDGSRPGAYYVNLADMRENPIYLIETLSYHEGAPGHHFQIALAQELEGVPMFQRLQGYSAFSEGWGLYAENLGKTMGGFTDPYQDFGRLSYEVFRAARLVVDTGMHAMEWSEQDAIDYMIANTPFPEGDIRNEVRRYMVWPGQAVSYKIGMLTILELRQRAMDALGDDFDWGEFHDVVLTNGSIPLTLLEQLVEDYIAEKQAETGED